MSAMEKEENSAPPPLPLGWTQVRRKKRARDDDTNTAADEIDWCCDDPNCKRTTQAVTTEPSSENTTTVQGTAVFLLHDANPDWFQGYLQIQGQRKPWGLLAIQETLDECLECKDGGYRQITLKVFSYNKDNKEPQVVEHVEWTGGDMMRLQSPLVSMETHSLVVGKKAVPFVDKYFASLVDKLRREVAEDDTPDQENDERADTTTVLGLLPDLAIVTGPMKLTFANTQQVQSEASTNAADENGAR